MERALFIIFVTFVINNVKSSYKKKKDLRIKKIRSLNDAWNGYLVTWGLEAPVAKVNMLTHVGLWPITTKPNPL